MKLLFVTGTFLMGLAGFTSCTTKCYNCRDFVTIEVEGEEIETNNFFEENTCKNSRKEVLELDGYVCAPQR